MPRSWLKRLVLAASVVALILAGCSKPQLAQPERTAVDLDGYHAEVALDDTSAQQELSTQGLSISATIPVVCPATSDSPSRTIGVQQRIVPVWVYEDRHFTQYFDVFWMPPGWNRDLVLYAHGYLPVGGPSLIDLLSPDNPNPPTDLLETRDLLLCDGYALAASAFSKNGYAVKEGVRDTHILNAIFPLLFRTSPSQRYVMGSSLGGMIALQIAEQHPLLYDGALTQCGAIGGSLTQFDYIANIRVMWDYYAQQVLDLGEADPLYPGTLIDPGTFPLSPDGSISPELVGEMTAALMGLGPTDPNSLLHLLEGTTVTYPYQPLGAPTFSGVPLLQLPALNPPYLDAFGLQSVIRPLFYQLYGTYDILARGDGSPYFNVGTTYHTPSGDVSFAASSPFGFTADSVALDYYTDYYQPTGLPRVWGFPYPIPILSMRNKVDPDVPAFHDDLYHYVAEQSLAPYGGVETWFRSLEVLSTGANPDYGHCEFQPSDTVTALEKVLVPRSASRVGGSWPDVTTYPDLTYREDWMY